MTVGEKIKIARSLRNLTQKELGYLVGLPDVRIRQYETNARTPKADKLNEIASALGVSYSFFVNHNVDTYDDIMQLLFEMEKNFNAHVEKIKTDSNQPTYGIIFDDLAMQQRLEAWYKKREDKSEKDIDTYEKEYMLWKARFPISLTDK